MRLGNALRTSALFARRDAVGIAAGAALVLAASLVLNITGLFDGITVVVTGLVLVGLGLLVGGGIVCLCQLSFAAIGAYAVSQLSLWNAPGTLPAWILAGGLVAGASGLVIGLAALRLRGVRLAILTLAFAAMTDAVFSVVGFPGAAALTEVTRPSYLFSARQYFIFAGLTLVAGAFAAVVFSRSGNGLALRCMRSSERATAAIGCSVARTKLVAFTFAAMLAGIAGGIEVGQSGVAVESAFAPVQSLSLLALAVMIGVEYAGGAVAGGLISTVVPNVLGDLGISPSYALMLFGAGAIPALRGDMPPGEQLRMTIRGRWLARARPPSRPPSRPPGPVVVRPRGPGRRPAARDDAALEVADIEVRYGAVAALDGVSLTVEPGELVGLIGPNGAGKSTLVDVVTGFVMPSRGSVHVDGARMDGLPPQRRARAGLRRTFQQDRVPAGLRVEQYLRLAAGRPVTDAEIAEALELVDGPAPWTPVGVLDAGNRRLVEVAAGFIGRPGVLVLDEPTAGLGLETRAHLAGRLLAAMAKYGTSVLLIEHDLDMIRAACGRVYVLDYGRLIAEGSPDMVLRSEAVSRAYIGDKAER